MFIRYPGSKAKINYRIKKVLPDDMLFPLWNCNTPLYAEPFFGSGAMGWEICRILTSPYTRVVVGDIDPGIVALWKATRDAPKELATMVGGFEPSPERFYQFKEQDGNRSIDPVVLGFQKLALHQMSFSGLGYKAGGPLGGKEPSEEYNTSCRWNPAKIALKIFRCHKLMRRFASFDIRCADFAEILRAIPADGFAYLDPPYYVQGPALYRYAMSEHDHCRLAEVLKSARFRWRLSYDDHCRIRELYSWAHITSFDMTPTVSRQERRKNREIVISSPE